MVAGVAALAACGPGEEAARDRDQTPAQASASPPAWVGSATCASCHAEEAERWRGSHHDLAMQEASEASVLGDFADASLRHFATTTRFFRREGRFFVATDGPAGEPGEFEVAYVFGVFPLQQYLVRLPGGRLQALPFAWDSRPAAEGGQRWFHLYPDEVLPAGDVLHWAGPNQNWNHMCAECHSTGLEKGYVAAEDRFETRWAELDVACEACHGPGSRHVAWAREDGDAGESGLGLAVDLGGNEHQWVFDPGAAIARRDPPSGSRNELEVCARCHSRREVIAPIYEPGRPLLDTHRLALLDEGLYFPDGQIRDEVYVHGSFLQSRMHAAGVVCSDCHDPHRLSIEGEADAACARCHRPEVFSSPAHHLHAEGSPGASCVACHMPERVYMQVDARRDHGFRVPRPDLAEALGAPDVCTGCHTDRSPGWAADLLRERFGPPPASPHFGEVLALGRRGDPGAARALARLLDDHEQPPIVRASALRLLREHPDAGLLGAIEAAAGDPDPLVRMAALEAASPLPPEWRVRVARPRLRDPVRAVRIQAARILAAVAPQHFAPGDRARVNAALAEWRAARNANADRPEAQVELGLLYAELGDVAKARRAYQTALAQAPWFVPAYANLADVHRLAGRDEEAERVLREGLAAAPDQAGLYHALGLTLVRRGRKGEALEALTRAAELAPEEPRHAYVLGVALEDAGRSEQAVAVLAAAHERHPGSRELLLALATVERDRGRTEQARRWAEKLVALAPGDRAAQALLGELTAGSAP